MNKLASVGDERWELAPHAHVVVYEASDGGELLTIYDCGAAQAPPRARLVGHLVRVDAAHVQTFGPTGYVVKLREAAQLVKQGESDLDHYVIRALDSAATAPTSGSEQ